MENPVPMAAAPPAAPGSPSSSVGERAVEGRAKILRWGNMPIDTFAPSSRHGHCSAIIGDGMYVFGGMENANRTNSTVVLDLKSKRWSRPMCDGTDRDTSEANANFGDTQVKPLPPPRTHCAHFIYGPHLYIHGGEGASLPPSERHNKDDHHLPETDDDLNAAFSNKKQFVEITVLSDARPPRTCMDDMWMLDTSKRPLSWELIPTALSPLPRKLHTTAIASHLGEAVVILFGGAPSGRKDPSNALYWVEAASLEGVGGKAKVAMWNRAAAKGAPPAPRYGHTCTRLTINKLAVFGGSGSNGELYNDIAILDTENFVWSIVGSWIGKEPAGRFGHAAFAVSSYDDRVDEQAYVGSHSTDVDSSSLIIFGGACLSSKEDAKSRKKFRRTKRRDGHVVYSHDLHAFDFATKEWRTVRSGVTHPNARYDMGLAISAEYGSSNLLGPADPHAPTLTGANLNPNIERDGGRYAVLWGGFNAVSVAGDVWAVSLEWENAGCGGDDPAEFELRGADFGSLVREGNGNRMIGSASEPTLLAGSASNQTLSSSASTVRFHPATKDAGTGAGAGAGAMGMSHSASAKDILIAEGVDVESIEKALINFKREKIIASKEAAEERQERIKLENIIKSLEDSLKELEEKKKEAEESAGDEATILRQRIETQERTIADLKMQVKEQQQLMLQMDMSRIEELGVLRHVKGARIEAMVDKGQDTVEEWRLVPIKMNIDTDVQVDVAELGEGGEITLAMVKAGEEELKEAHRKKELSTWVKDKKVVDGEEVVECGGVEGKELGFADHILANSPRKGVVSARSALASSRSSNRPLSVRIQEPGVGEEVVEEEVAEEVGAQVEGVKGGKGMDESVNPRSRTPPESETARLTVVPSYTGGQGEGLEGVGVDESSRPPTAETQIVNETNLSNPFSDAFTNLPEMECTLPPPELLATSRTGVSDMSDSILETGRLTTGIAAEGEDLLKFTYKQKATVDDSYLTAKPTKVKVAAVSTLQSTWRRRLAMSVYSSKLSEFEERKKLERLESMKADESEDEEYNALVDENEHLHIQNVKMTQTMERMMRELEQLKGKVKEEEDVVEGHGGHGGKKSRKK
ncbi:hypothetical protein TrVE_jg12647 [Triparma verrucosa]|uniref:Kelch repeat-containing protein n=1 Tax=Triparma verrucosa TaxID=1606542 RepID=A0A9W7KRR0_9STRA|nr:hypothetical protein TrVE_jg12647 [Triparma verrucosa]